VVLFVADYVAEVGTIMAASNPPIVETTINDGNVFDLKQAALKDIIVGALIGLDASVLLQLYEMDENYFKVIGEVYSSLSKANRLIVPAQAAREFALNRARKISEVTAKLESDSNKISDLSLSSIPFLEEDEDYKKIRLEFQQIKEIRKRIVGTTANLVNKLKRNVGDDPVSNLYREVFGGAVRNYDVEESEFLDDLTLRYAERLPPGFKDSGKHDGGRGDLQIWKTILQEGKKQKLDFIFVTNDNKTDWFVQQNKTTFQLRPELLYEYWKVTSGKSIHLISLSSFLTLWSQMEIILKATQEAILNAAQEARKVEEIDDYYENRFDRQIVTFTAMQKAIITDIERVLKEANAELVVAKSVLSHRSSQLEGSGGAKDHDEKYAQYTDAWAVVQRLEQTTKDNELALIKAKDRLLVRVSLVVDFERSHNKKIWFLCLMAM